MPRPIEQVTPRLLLRQWRDDDVEPLVALNADPEVSRYLGGTITRAESEAMAVRMRVHWAERSFGVWALELRDGESAGGARRSLIGLCGIVVPRYETKFSPFVEILWRLAPACWGKGLVTEAAHAALDDGFAHHDFPAVVALTVQQNQRSWRVMERLGMRRAPEDDFDHPLVREGDPLRPHVVYRVSREAWTRHTATR
jgi:ribosomal-protein-alanine N-acetyltransferase